MIGLHFSRVFINIFIKYCRGDFPGGPVAETLCFQCKGPRFDPWSGNYHLSPGHAGSSLSRDGSVLFIDCPQKTESGLAWSLLGPETAVPGSGTPSENRKPKGHILEPSMVRGQGEERR